MRYLLPLILLITSAAGAQTIVGVSRTATSQTPNPFPILDRICCGSQSNWTGIEPSRGTYVFTLIDNYVASSALHPPAVPVYTDRATTTWANGTGATTTAPTDLAISAACQNVLTGTTTTDCQYKEFITAFMQHVCSVSSQPVSPLVGVCKVKVFETWNEMNVGVYWTDTVGKLAQMAEDKATIIRLYCGDCTVVGGSVSAGGDGTGGSWINGSVGLEPFLAAWGALTSPHLPDAISWHAYPSRTTIKPVPFPETLVAHGSGTCTGSSNSSCRTAIKDQVSTLYSSAILCNAAITAWACALPVWQTEGGYGINSGLTDGVSDSSPTTYFLRGAYISRWMAVLAATPSAGTPPPFNLAYSWQDQCWGTNNGTNVADTNCQPPDSVIPSGVTPVNTAILKMNGWLTRASSVGTLSSSSVSGGNIWTLPLTVAGQTQQLAWFDGWLTTSTFSTPFGISQTLAGVNSAISGTVVLTNQPTLLSGSGQNTFWYGSF